MKPIGLGGWSLNTHRPHPEEAQSAVWKEAAGSVSLVAVLRDARKRAPQDEVD